MSNAIQLDGVCKSYPGSGRRAVDDVSLSVEAGTIVTLLGPSGCGKTTTLRLIAGFERPDAGRIRLGERTVADGAVWIPAEQRGVGMVFQEHALFPHLTVARNVGFNLKGPDAASRVANMLAIVGLTGLGDRMPHQLSGGQQQRVALARALAHDPVVVLMDEPFSSLDADLRAQMRSEVRRILKAAGATAVIVSHDQHDALSISDTIVIMREGRVEQVGSPLEVYESPRTRFVAEFVGTSTVISGAVSQDGAGIETHIGMMPFANHRNLVPGRQLLVSIRPDGLRIDDSGTLQATVISSVYAGTRTDVVLRTDSAEGPVELLAHARAEDRLDVGDVVWVRVDPRFVVPIEV